MDLLESSDLPASRAGGFGIGFYSEARWAWAGAAVSEERASVGGLATVAAGAVIGAVEVVLAISFAALVFGAYLSDFLAEGIGMYLIAAAVTHAILTWKAYFSRSLTNS